MIIELKHDNEPKTPRIYFRKTPASGVIFVVVEFGNNGGYGMPSEYNGLHIGCTKMCDYHSPDMQWSDKLSFQITVDQ